jgi:GNAT superfamily N-acetyltransferase
MTYPIRKLSVSELFKLEALGQQFTRESKWVKFNIESFVQNWENYMLADIGEIFVAHTEEGEIVGAIGGIRFEEPNSGMLMANELFWIVAPDHRGHCGIQLLNRLEEWAKESNCIALWMNYLVDSMPERVQAIYEKKGFTMVETHWVKEI